MITYFNIKVSQNKNEENTNQENNQPLNPVNQPINPDNKGDNKTENKPLNVPAQSQPANPVPTKKIRFVGKEDFQFWQKVIVDVPRMDIRLFKEIESLADNFLNNYAILHGSLPPWGVYQGKKAIWKLFSKDKVRGFPYVSIMITAPEFFSEVIAFFREKQYDTSALEQFRNVNPQEDKGNANIPNKTAVIKRLNGIGRFELSFTANQDISNYIKDNFDSKYVKQTNSLHNKNVWIFSNQLPEKLVSLCEFMAQREYNVVNFVNYIHEYDKELEDRRKLNIEGDRIPNFEDVSDQTHFLISLQYPQDFTLRAEMAEFVKFSFPSVGNLSIDMLPVGNLLPGQPRPAASGMRVERNGKWYLFGSFDELVRFANLLKNSKWDVRGLRSITAALIRNNKIPRTKFSGQIDGYEAMQDGKQLRDDEGNPRYRTKDFDDDLLDLIRVDPETGEKIIKPFEKQNAGIRWLYSRHSCILGDDTGTGKTFSCLGAAGMRLKQSGGRALIFTLPRVKNQWKEEIIKIFGLEDKDVSFDPSSDSKWVIMSYSDLSAKPESEDDEGRPVYKFRARRVQRNMHALLAAQFTVIILDEAHALKNLSSAKSINIQMLIDKIPYKWGATATPAANTSKDVHSLLKILGHTLGKLSTTEFEKEFVGIKGNTKNIEDEDIIAQQEAATYKLRKWLTLSGAYLSRSKKAINPNLPDHTVEEKYIEETDFDTEKFVRELASGIRTTGAAATLAKMQRQRHLLAKAKVPNTIEEAKKILDEGGKVLIFSCFKTPCSQIIDGVPASSPDRPETKVEGLREYLAKQNRYYKVVHIIDGDKEKDIQQAIKSFKEEDGLARVMVISALKGGTGISLENSTSEVIMNDFDWAPRTVEQTEGRAYRINNVIPVRTRYMVAKNKNKEVPDEIFYRYVRNKTRLASLIKDLDSEAEQYILKGLDDSQIQKRIENARKEQRETELKLREDLRRLLINYGEEEAAADLVRENNQDLGEDIADTEDQIIFETDNNNDDLDKKASTWYKRAFADKDFAG